MRSKTASQAAEETSALPPDGDPYWTDKFAADYAAQAADGPAGRFYKGTADVTTFAGMMGDDEYASFKAAFQSRTLSIQSAQDIPDVKITGESDTSFISTCGKGMSLTGDMTVDTTKVNSKYSLVVGDPFFDPTIISWGGPKIASAAAT